MYCAPKLRNPSCERYGISISTSPSRAYTIRNLTNLDQILNSVFIIITKSACDIFTDYQIVMKNRIDFFYKKLVG